MKERMLDLGVREIVTDLSVILQESSNLDNASSTSLQESKLNQVSEISENNGMAINSEDASLAKTSRAIKKEDTNLRELVDSVKSFDYRRCKSHGRKRPIEDY